MKPEDSLPCTQQPTTTPYPEPAEFSPDFLISQYNIELNPLLQLI